MEPNNSLAVQLRDVLRMKKYGYSSSDINNYINKATPYFSERVYGVAIPALAGATVGGLSGHAVNSLLYPITEFSTAKAIRAVELANNISSKNPERAKKLLKIAHSKLMLPNMIDFVKPRLSLGISGGLLGAFLWDSARIKDRRDALKSYNYLYNKL